MSRARDLEALAAKLRRPAKSLEAFARLAPEEIETLSDAIDAAFDRERQRVGAALDRAIPRLLRPLASLVLGSRQR
jgi:hypothetical protein